MTGIYKEEDKAVLLTSVVATPTGEGDRVMKQKKIQEKAQGSDLIEFIDRWHFHCYSRVEKVA